MIPPSKTDAIKTDDGRLFARLEVWDYSKNISLAFRSKAMLHLASLGDDQQQQYEELVANGELRHPVLASLRLQMQTKRKQPDASPTKPSQTQFDNLLSSVVVEAVPCTFSNIPNDSVQAIHGLLASFLQTSDRLAAVPLDTLKPSPFYNILAHAEPAAKALTLLHFTQRGNGKQLSHGFRIVTERVQDPTAGVTTEVTSANQYAIGALCTVEKLISRLRKTRPLLP